MEIYNGQYQQNIYITISCGNHDDTLKIASLIKKYCDAWYFCVTISENKSARKGDVLKRGIAISQTDYAHDIIIFREGLKQICFHYNLYYPTVIIEINSIIPKDIAVNSLR